VPPEKKQLDDQDNEGNQEHENGNAVDTMHVSNPLRVGGVGVLLPDV